MSNAHATRVEEAASARPDLVLVDSRGYTRAKATMPGYGKGRPPRNKGRRYPPTAPTAEELAVLLAACPDSLPGKRFHALVVTLVSTGLRISEALKLEEHDLDRAHKRIRVREGKNRKSRTVGMNDWGWAGIDAWLHVREQFPAGPVFCVVHGPTAGQPWSSSCVRRCFRETASAAGIRKHMHAHALRHCFTVESMRNGAMIHLLQRQLGHASLDNTMRYFASIDDDTVVDHFSALPGPTIMIPTRR